MPNPYFAFKQFTVYHDACAMKVGTDGCLLGAWASHENPVRILDIGAGSGLISLMLAQRFPSAQIDAVEIERVCAEQCIQNINSSAWKTRIRTHNLSVTDFQPSYKYDLIVSNPPFFSNDFMPEKETRKTARHDHSLSVETLFDKAKCLLVDSGSFSLIIPVDREDDFTLTAAQFGFFLTKKVSVKPTPFKASKRLLLQFKKLHEPLLETELIVEIERGKYSPDFIALLRGFYLYL